MAFGKSLQLPLAFSGKFKSLMQYCKSLSFRHGVHSGGN